MSLMTGKGKRKYYSTLFYIMEIFNWKQIISKHKLFFLKGGQFLCHYSKRYLCFIHVTMVHEINALNKLFRQILITIMKSNKQTTTTTFKNLMWRTYCTYCTLIFLNSNKIIIAIKSKSILTLMINSKNKLKSLDWQ